MSDEKLLEELAMAAQKARAKEPNTQWDALAAGELSADEREALLAADEDGQLQELFTPLGDDFEANVLHDILGGGESAPPVEAAEPGPPPEGGPDSVTPKPANKPFWMLWAAPVIAVAAALLLVFAMPGGGPDLPDYSWEIAGGDQVVRGSDTTTSGTVALSVGTALTISARPDEPMEGELTATAFVRQADGSVQPSLVVVQLADSGAVRWVGRAGDGALQPGATEVIVVVHPADTPAADVMDGAWPRVVVPVVVGPGQ